MLHAFTVCLLLTAPGAGSRKDSGRQLPPDGNICAGDAQARSELGRCVTSEKQCHPCGGINVAVTAAWMPEPQIHLMRVESADPFFNILKMRAITGATDSSANTFSSTSAW